MTRASGERPDQATSALVPVPMRDGVVLRATVLRPKASGRFPTLVFRTPYGVERALAVSPVFADACARGYAVVLQDVRGRFASDGEFDPYRQEGADGYDTIEWAAAQPWSSGDVGTFGLSYPGAVQWLAAAQSPPHLRAMVPTMTFAHPGRFFHAGGVFDLSWIAWIWLNIAPEQRRRKGLPGHRTIAEAEAAWPRERDDLLYRMPLTDVPEIAEIAPWYLDWLRHPPGDPWWDWAVLGSRYGRVEAAVLNVSGWYDEHYGPDGALANHEGLCAARAGDADPRSWLLLGPWVHGFAPPDDPEGQRRAGQRRFGPAARIDFEAEILSFMDRHLRGLDTSPAPPRVRAYVMGEERWLTGERWPLPGTATRRLWLDTARGALRREPPRAAARAGFVSDPARPVVDPYVDVPGAHDYRALGEHPGALVFESAPLARPLRVLGRMTAEIYLETDAPDLDVWVKLLDVAPDGTAWNLMSPGADVVRIGPAPSTRSGARCARLEGALTGNLFPAGNRIRIVISSSFMPHFARNPQTGERETETAVTRAARVEVLSGPAHPSHLVLPAVD